MPRLIVVVFLLLFGFWAAAAPAPASVSKISVHLLSSYSPGAAQIIQAHPRVIKILDTSSGMIQAARDFKASTPDGKVVCRIFTSRRWTTNDNPAVAGTNFWQLVLAPALMNLSAADRALIDYVEGPNEGDSTPTWQSATNTLWFNAFWLHLAPLIANAGFRPLAFSISVGNPPGTISEIHATLDRIVPALRRCRDLGGGWSYHSYSLPYSTNLTDEIWYSVRYRQYYSYFVTQYPDLVNLPLVLTEGGIDGAGPWSTRGDTNKFQNWLAWFDSEIRKDAYCLGVTLFQIGNTTDWAGFNVEPVAGWIARHLTANSASTNPPRLSLALVVNLTTVAVTLSEPANAASAGNRFNYTLRRADNGTQVSVGAATLADGTNVTLRTSGFLQPYTDYVLTVSNIGPSGTSGPLPGLTGTTNLLFTLKLVGIDAETSWKYEDSGANQGTAWRALAFNDAGWSNGPALLGFETNALPEPLRTQVAFQSSKATYYFRMHFHWPLTNAIALLSLRQVIDDGVVFYLNGHELHRTGMSNNPVYYTNFASRTVSEAAYEGPFVVLGTNLVYGANVLAAEVHQPSAGSSDVVFGAKLDALILPSSVPFARPWLSVQNSVSSNVFYLSWSNSAFFLEAAPAYNGPWTAVTPRANPYTVHPTNLARFYRLRQ